MRRTRILATLGPSTSDVASIQALIRAGADAFRLNFSHGTADLHEVTCRNVRSAASACGADIAVLQDLGGPKIRTGTVPSPLRLVEGETLDIECGSFQGQAGRVSCEFAALFESVSVGTRLLVDDGRIELQVVEAGPDALRARVITGGLLESHKGINVPSVALRTSALSDKDVADLKAGIAMGVDLVAVSFVQSPDDMVQARAVADAAGAPGLPLVAKIEKPPAVERLEEILAVSDALMVARGDLGVEMPLEQLPAAQKRIVGAARRHGVPVILATQVLESMRQDPRPTRAEVTDAAHAVDECVDAIMLAGETASGKYPVKAVATLDTIIREAERVAPARPPFVPEDRSWSAHGLALGEAAVALADRAHADVIVAMTSTGKTARLLAAMRPNARVIAVTPDRRTAARLALVWGVTPVVMDHPSAGEVRDTLVARGLVARGDVIVVCSSHSQLTRDDRNFVRVERA